jgi:hypothetical protein
MKPGDVFAVFEEDAHFSASGAAKLKLLHDYVQKNSVEYDLIFIGINRIPAPSGEITSLPVRLILISIFCSVIVDSNKLAGWGRAGAGGMPQKLCSLGD